MAEAIARDTQAGAIRRTHEFATADDFQTRLIREIRTRVNYLHEAWRLFQKAHVVSLQAIVGAEQRAPHEQTYTEIEEMFLNADAIMQERITNADRAHDDDQSEYNSESDRHSEGAGNNDRNDSDDVRQQHLGHATSGNDGQAQGAATANQAPAVVPANWQFPWQFPIENVWGEFHGDKKKWQSFHDSFKASVYDNDTLPPVRKFQLLRAALKGNAAKSLGEWQVSDRNFEPAWERLKTLYHDPYTTSNELLHKLYGLKKLDEPSGVRLQIISNVAQEVTRQLGALGHPVEHYDMIFVHLVQAKLDDESSRAWDLKRGDNDRPTLNELTMFLDKRAKSITKHSHSQLIEPKAQSAKGSERKRPFNGHSHQGQNKRFRSNPVGQPTVIKPERKQCATCSEEHQTRKCPVFLKMSLTNRKEKARQANLCFNCLGHGHTIKDCKFGPCTRCERKHNSLLCSENPNNRHVNAGQVVSKRKRNRKGQKPQSKAA